MIKKRGAARRSPGLPMPSPMHRHLLKTPFPVVAVVIPSSWAAPTGADSDPRHVEGARAHVVRRVHLGITINPPPSPDHEPQLETAVPVDRIRFGPQLPTLVRPPVEWRLPNPKPQIPSPASASNALASPPVFVYCRCVRRRGSRVRSAAPRGEKGAGLGVLRSSPEVGSRPFRCVFPPGRGGSARSARRGLLRSVPPGSGRARADGHGELGACLLTLAVFWCVLLAVARFARHELFQLLLRMPVSLFASNAWDASILADIDARVAQHVLSSH